MTLEQQQRVKPVRQSRVPVLLLLKLNDVVKQNPREFWLNVR